MTITTAAVGRFDRSHGRSMESIGSVGSVILRIFRFFCHVGELEICLVSKFQLCTTLGGRKNAEKPKHEFFEFFGSVGSVFRSVRSILRPRVVVDRPGYSVSKKFVPRTKKTKRNENKEKTFFCPCGVEKISE